MRILQRLTTRRAMLGLGLAGLLAAAVGCDSTNDVTQSTSKGEDNPGLARQKAREAAFGKAGMPTGKQAGTPKK